MKNLLCGFLLIWSLSLPAQTTRGLVAYYPFDGSFKDVTGNTANEGLPAGSPSFTCGVQGDALLLNGNDQVVFAGSIANEFDREDLSISFYFKSTGETGTQYLLSKAKMDCDTDSALLVRYVPSSRTINSFFSETPTKSASLVEQLSPDQCWHHITLVREGPKVRLYVNGEMRNETGTNGRVSLLNDGDLILGGRVCLGSNEGSFQGVIDELRFYNRALTNSEVESLYSGPDQILTSDTLIFLGNSVNVRINVPCATLFSWSPTAGVQTPDLSEPVITPTQPGISVYTVEMDDALSNCQARDSFRINVIDPADLDCNLILLPNVFTPNNDGLNDNYGISNPYAVEKLLSFEIFDRWGNRIFFTDDPFQQWDGTYQGTQVNPGVFLYKIELECRGETRLISGSLAILR